MKRDLVSLLALGISLLLPLVHVRAQSKADFYKFEVKETYKYFNDYFANNPPAGWPVIRAQVINNRRDFAGGFSIANSPAAPTYNPFYATPFIVRGDTPFVLGIPSWATGGEVVRMNDNGDLIVHYKRKPEFVGVTGDSAFILLEAANNWLLDERLTISAPSYYSYVSDINNAKMATLYGYTWGLDDPMYAAFLRLGSDIAPPLSLPTRIFLGSKGGTVLALNDQNVAVGEQFINANLEIVPARFTLNGDRATTERIPPLNSGCEMHGTANDINNSGVTLITRRTQNDNGSMTVAPVLFKNGALNDITPAMLKSSFYPISGWRLNNRGDGIVLSGSTMGFQFMRAMYFMNESRLYGFNDKLLAPPLGSNEINFSNSTVYEVMAINDSAEMLGSIGSNMGPFPGQSIPPTINVLLLPRLVKGDHNNNGILYRDIEDMYVARDCYYNRPLVPGIVRNCSVFDLNNDGVVSAGEYSAMYRQYIGISDGAWSACVPPTPLVQPSPTPTPK